MSEIGRTEIAQLNALIDDAVIERQSGATEALICATVDRIDSLVNSNSKENFEVVIKIANIIAYSVAPKPETAATKVLLDVAFSMVLRARSAEALPFAHRSIAISNANGPTSELRRSHSVCAILFTDVGLIANAIEHLIKALRLASQLHDQKAKAIALVNLTAALYSCGLNRECINISLRILDTFPRDGSHHREIGAILSNAANSHISLGQFSAAAQLVVETEKVIGTATDSEALFQRLVNLWNAIRCAVAMDDENGATRCVSAARESFEAFRTQRTELVYDLICAAHQICAKNTSLATFKLRLMLERSIETRSLYRDNLELLVRAYEKAGDRANALVYLGKLVDFIGKTQMDNVKRALDTLEIKLQTPVPGRDDMREVLAAIQRGDPLPRNRAEVPLVQIWETYETFALTAELKEDPSGRHVYRVGKLARLLSEARGQPNEFSIALERAARLHDIGKLGLPDDVVMNTGALTSEQHQAMQKHCEIGVQIIDQTTHPALSLAREVAQSHHERWDGSGYPQGLAGEAIPLAARIVAIAETYDVLTHGRTYRPACSHTEALAIMQAGAGTQFDPTLIKAFMPLANALHEKHGDDLAEFLAEAANESSFLQAKNEMDRLIDAL
jgi:putative two-component system response regulator